ncbi:MAG: hypothetical protein GX051_02380 [Clostridiales bacterium]|nr:hypothetical protein [Clostridiales bacterium]
MSNDNKNEKENEQKRYQYKPREYDREERITLQKIVAPRIPVTRKLLAQDVLVKATNDFIAKNIRIGSTAAEIINTTDNPGLFFSRLQMIIESTEALVKVAPFWRFEGRQPQEQLDEINDKKDTIVFDFLDRSFDGMLEKLSKKKSGRGKQKIFDEYQSVIMTYSKLIGEQGVEHFKQRCETELM